MNHFVVHQKLICHCRSTLLQFKKRKKEKLWLLTVLSTTDNSSGTKFSLFYIHYIVAVKRKVLETRVKGLEPDCLGLNPNSATSYLSEFRGPKFLYL